METKKDGVHPMQTKQDGDGLLRRLCRKRWRQKKMLMKNMLMFVDSVGKSRDEKWR